MTGLIWESERSTLNAQRPSMHLLPGLVSISFRGRTPAELIAATARAGLQGIEWGGDRHVPHGNLAVAREVAARTREAGLDVAAYGSYYRVGRDESQQVSFAQVLDTAAALQAPLIRVWAGEQGSAETSPAGRQRIIAESRRIGRMARAAGLGVAFEFHRHTLTDTTGSALDLLQATAAAGLRGYWQPSVGWSREEQLDALCRLRPYLAHLHVYQWDADGRREPLAAGTAAWSDFLAEAAAAPLPEGLLQRWALLEFVKDDSLDQFRQDAETLTRMLGHAGGSRHGEGES